MNRFVLLSLVVLLSIVYVAGEGATGYQGAKLTVGTGVNCDLNVGSIGGGAPGLWNLAVKLGWVNSNPSNQYNMCVYNAFGSIDLYAGMQFGVYDLTSAQFDNALSRQVNGQLPLVTLGGDSRGGGQAVVGNIRNGAVTMDDLKAKRGHINIGVDAVQSGLVYGLRKVLAVYGLYYEAGDYEFVICGGTPVRTTCTQQGWVIDPNGVNQTIHASSLPSSAVISGVTSNLALVSDFIAPLQSTAIQVLPSVLSAKNAKLVTLMYHLIRAQKFYANPANKDYIINTYLGGSAPGKLASAQASYAAFFDLVNGQVTATNDFTFQQQSILNVVYVRQQFGGFNASFAPLDYDFNALLTPGPGKFIDYTVRDSALTAVITNLTVAVNHPQADVNQCYSYATGQTVTMSNFLAGLRNSVSGSCTGAPVLTFVSATTSDPTAQIGDFTYNAATDTLTLIANTNYPSSTARSVTIKVSVSDPCTQGAVDTITQVYTFNHGAVSGCSSLKPPCTVSVAQTLTSSWFSNGVQTYEYTLSINNPSSSQNVQSVVFQLSQTDVSNIQSMWNLPTTSGNAPNLYTLPNWQNGIAAGQSYTSAGYIVNNAQATFNVYSATCA